MKLILILVAVLVVCLLVYKQIAPSEESMSTKANLPQDVPKVPTNPNDLKEFGDQMDEYMQLEAAAAQ